MNEHDSTKTSDNSHSMSECLSVEVAVKVLIASVSVGYSQCKGSSEDIATTNQTSSRATNTIVDNVGGRSDDALTFVGDGATEESRAAFWDGVRQNPGILTKDLDIICTLIQYTRVNKFKRIRDNCQKALLDYLTHHAAIKCDPCLNGGMSINMNQTCYCACPRGATGEKCETLKSERTAVPSQNLLCPVQVTNC